MSETDLAARVAALERRTEHLSALVSMLSLITVAPDQIDPEERAFMRRFLAEEGRELGQVAIEDAERLKRDLESR
jgi:hypothetical protein